MNYFIDGLRNYVKFDGRASRKQFWMYYLFYVILAFVAGMVDGVLQSVTNNNSMTPVTSLLSLALLLPTIAIEIRRMHDTDHSGWWILVPIVNLVFLCTAGTPGPNRFGPDPKLGEGLAPGYGAPGYPAGGYGTPPAGYGTPPATGYGAAPQDQYTPPMPPIPAQAAAPAAAPAGWLPDPVGRHEFRYWDGMQWTANVSDAGVTAVDPI